MPHLRLLMATRSGWFAALVACALAVRLLVPAGFMPVAEGGGIALRICPGTMPGPSPATPAMHAMPGMAAHQPASGRDHHDGTARAEMPCAFAGVGLAALGSAPPVLLAAALAFAFARVARSTPQSIPTRTRLRPPLRAPPRAS